jgi:poly-gamma-glutamate synthesis protein (capsule biosynthesis protein)
MLKRIFTVVLMGLAAACVLSMSARPGRNTVSISARSGQETVTVALTGDVLLDRGVRKILDSRGADYPYEKIKCILERYDIVFGNLECPITQGGAPVLKNRNLIFRADVKNAAALKKAGYNVLNLANNHVMDYGPEGLENTLEALEKEGIKAVGAGEDCKKARQPVFVNVRGIIVGFLGYSAFPHEGYFYFPDRPDVACVDTEKLESEIKNAKKDCDFLIVYFHWGKEFDFYPSGQQRELAYLAANSGADIVAGHHPHVLQPVEEYKGKYIFYSLGNFVFDKQVPWGTDETVIVGLTLSRKGIEDMRLIPVRIKNCQPAAASGEDARTILEKLSPISLLR